MSEQRVGTCSLCGGDVVGVRGAWMSILPPPPDRCSSCGAVRADDVIEMRQTPMAGRRTTQITTTTTAHCSCGTSAVCPIHSVPFSFTTSQ